MLDFPIWRRVMLWGVTLLLAAAALPSIFTLAGSNAFENSGIPEINLGLDLAGGSHILLEADASEVAAQRLESLEESVRDALANADPRIVVGDVSTAGGSLSFMLENPADLDRAREELLPLINGNGMVREWDLRVEDGNRMILSPTEQGLVEAVANAMDAATEVVRRRIDGMGTREPTIIRQGDTRICLLYTSPSPRD